MGPHSWQQALALSLLGPSAPPDAVAGGPWEGTPGLTAECLLPGLYVHVHLYVCVTDTGAWWLSTFPLSLCSIPLLYSHSSPSWPTCVSQAAGLQTRSKSSPASLVTSLATTQPQRHLELQGCPAGVTGLSPWRPTDPWAFSLWLLFLLPLPLHLLLHLRCS